MFGILTLLVLVVTIGSLAMKKHPICVYGNMMLVTSWFSTSAFFFFDVTLPLLMFCFFFVLATLCLCLLFLLYTFTYCSHYASIPALQMQSTT